MKILHVYKNYYPYTLGGVEKHIFHLTEGLSRYGIKNTILTTKNKQDGIQQSQIGNCSVHYFPTNWEIASCPFSISMLNHFSEIADQFDIIHYHFPWPFADLMQILTAIDKPIVVSYHADIIRQRYLKLIYSPLMRIFLKRANAIIVSSDNYLHSSLVLKDFLEKTTVIPYGMNLLAEHIVNKEILEQWRTRVGERFFLFVGVLRYYKGLDFLLEAVKNCPLKLVIAGAGPEQTRLMQIKKDQHLDNVYFTGKINEQDKAALFHLCRATVSSAHLRAEAFSLSLLESLLFGKPVISTELNTGTSFINQHELTGLVVPPSNSVALREAMEKLNSDEQLYQRLSSGTQVHYQRHFTVEDMTEKHLKLYQRVSNSSA